MPKLALRSAELKALPYDADFYIIRFFGPGLYRQYETAAEAAVLFYAVGLFLFKGFCRNDIALVSLDCNGYVVALVGDYYVLRVGSLDCIVA